MEQSEQNLRMILIPPLAVELNRCSISSTTHFDEEASDENKSGVRSEEAGRLQAPTADSQLPPHICGDRRSSSFPAELERFSEERRLLLLDCIVGTASSFALTNSSLLHTMEGRVETIPLDSISSLTTNSEGKIILLGRWEEEEEEDEPETLLTGPHISTFNIVAMASFLERVHAAIMFRM